MPGVCDISHKETGFTLFVPWYLILQCDEFRPDCLATLCLFKQEIEAYR